MAKVNNAAVNKPRVAIAQLAKSWIDDARKLQTDDPEL